MLFETNNELDVFLDIVLQNIRNKKSNTYSEILLQEVKGGTGDPGQNKVLVVEVSAIGNVGALVDNLDRDRVTLLQRVRHKCSEPWHKRPPCGCAQWSRLVR